MSSLLNRKAVRQYTLDYAKRSGRGGVITAVGDSAYTQIEAAVRREIRRMVETHPSSFKTLKGDTP